MDDEICERDPTPTARPLTVAVFGGNPSLFDYLSDPRIEVRSLDGEDPRVPDVLVLCRPEHPNQEDWRGVPEAVWRSAAAGRTKLVLDGSLEGVPLAAMSWREIHRLLDERGIRPRDVAYVTQDRPFETDYLELCRRIGQEPMHVFVYDYFLHRLVLSYHDRGNGEEVFSRRLSAFEAAGQSRARVFLNLNFTPRPNKLIFLLNLVDQGLWDDGLVSFGGFGRRGDSKDAISYLGKRMVRLAGFEDLSWRLLDQMEALDGKGRITFGLDEDPQTPVKKTYPDGLPQYASTWFSVVTETEMGNRLNRVTEKSFKPMLNFHPMLVLGNPHALALVRRYGFETFGEMFDESYDEETDPRRRFDLVFAELQRFCREDRRRLPHLVGAMAEKLQFNARHGLVELPKRFRRELQPAFISALLNRWKLEDATAA
jgi:hypothetical protein